MSSREADEDGGPAMRTVRLGTAIALTALAVLVTGCGSRPTGLGPIEETVEALPSPTGPQRDRVLPASIDPAALCTSIDAALVSELLGGHWSREVSWQAGDRAATGRERIDHGCQFEWNAAGEPVTFVVTAGARRAADLEEGRPHYGSDGFRKASCFMDAVGGLDPDRAFAASCKGVDEDGSSVPARHSVGIVVGEQLLRCVLRTRPAMPLPAALDTIADRCLAVLDEATG